MTTAAHLSAKVIADRGIYRERKLYTFLNHFGQDKMNLMSGIKNIIIN